MIVGVVLLASRASSFVAVPASTLVGRPGTSLQTSTIRPVAVRRRDDAVTTSTYTLYDSRWAQLGMLSLLALVSDWVCFATAAVPKEFAAATGHDPAQLIDVFLACNVLSCCFYTDVSKRLGLRGSTVFAAAVMAFGCLLRCGMPTSSGLPPYAALLAGTSLVGLAQPFFQCAPPLLSATWFSATERSLATATALNANQLGIAAAFVVGGSVVDGPETIKPYLETIAVASLVALALAAQFTRDKPPTPPTASAASKLEESGDDGPSFTFATKCLELLRTPGFNAALVAFVASICVTNLVSAFAEDALDRAGCPSSVAAVGASFQLAIVLGGIALGALVDKTRAYKSVTLLCLGTAFSLLCLLGVAQGYDATLPPVVVVVAVLALGAVAGPVQPINAELAVEVSHPFDENAVEATQQLAGNLVSALLVPAYQAAGRNFDLQVEPTDHHAHRFGLVHGLHEASFGLVLPEPADIFGRHLQTLDVRGDTLLLLGLTAVTFLVFANSQFNLRRASLDDALDS